MSKKSHCDSDEIVQNIRCETGQMLGQECSLVVLGLIQDCYKLTALKESWFAEQKRIIAYDCKVNQKMYRVSDKYESK